MKSSISNLNEDIKYSALGLIIEVEYSVFKRIG